MDVSNKNHAPKPNKKKTQISCEAAKGYALYKLLTNLEFIVCPNLNQVTNATIFPTEIPMARVVGQHKGMDIPDGELVVVDAGTIARKHPLVENLATYKAYLEAYKKEKDSEPDVDEQIEKLSAILEGNSFLTPLKVGQEVTLISKDTRFDNLATRTGTINEILVGITGQDADKERYTLYAGVDTKLFGFDARSLGDMFVLSHNGKLQGVLNFKNTLELDASGFLRGLLIETSKNSFYLDNVGIHLKSDEGVTLFGKWKGYQLDLNKDYMSYFSAKELDQLCRVLDSIHLFKDILSPYWLVPPLTYTIK